MIVVGGLGRASGAVLGAVLLVFVAEYLRFLKEYRMIAYGASLIVCMMFFPGGLAQLSALMIRFVRTNSRIWVIQRFRAEARARTARNVGAATAALEVRDLRKSFGGVRAVDGVDLTVKSGTVHGLIGPNGAGKTTVFNLITGQIRPERGRVLFNGSDITREAPHRIVRRGLIRTFQSAQLFPQMTVLENVRMGMHWRTRSGILDAILPGLGARGEETSVTEQALETLAFAGLVQIQDALASSLPYGVQRLVEVARALVGYPSLLLLDQQSAGLDTRSPGNSQS